MSNYWEQFDDGRNPAADYDECAYEDEGGDDYSEENEARIARHNENNPDTRRFTSKGVDSVNPHEEAEKQRADEIDNLRDNADSDEDEEHEEDEDEMTEADMHASMWQPGQ